MSGEYAPGNSHFCVFPRRFRDIDRSDLRNNLYTTFLEQGNIRRGFPALREGARPSPYPFQSEDDVKHNDDRC